MPPTFCNHECQIINKNIYFLQKIYTWLQAFDWLLGEKSNVKRSPVEFYDNLQLTKQVFIYIFFFPELCDQDFTFIVPTKN